MRPRLPFTAALIAVALAAPALADKDRGHGGQRAFHAQAWCPPGLAKKSPACIPPGQAKKHARTYHDRDADWRYGSDWNRYIRIGDEIDDRWMRIDDPYRYGLNPDYFYYRALDRVFRIDPQTRQVLSFIGLVDALLN
jgi:hypothetical protein